MSRLELILNGAQMACERLGQEIAMCHGTLEEITDQVLLRRLEEYGGNKMATARSLGINVKTLYNRLKRIDSK